jgi:chromosomal replication initiation ATPase DnaA
MTPTMRSVTEEVCARHRVGIRDVTSPSKALQIYYVRAEAMWLIRQLQSGGKHRFSFPQIGRFFGCHHTSVIRAVRHHEATLCQSEAA